jgi:hypothetical protein
VPAPSGGLPRRGSHVTLGSTQLPSVKELPGAILERRLDRGADLVVLGNRLFDVRDLYDLRRSVSAINGGFHAALARSFHRNSLGWAKVLYFVEISYPDVRWICRCRRYAPCSNDPRPAQSLPAEPSPSVSLRELVPFARGRWPIEHPYRELKDELGLDHFEGRSYRGWNHHAVIAALACTFLQIERRRGTKPLERSFSAAAQALPLRQRG